MPVETYDAQGNLIQGEEKSAPPVKAAGLERFDSTGSPVGKFFQTNAPGVTQQISPERQIHNTPDALREAFRTYIAPLVKAGFLYGGGTVGGGLTGGNPVGAGLGVAAGDQINQLAEKFAPNYFGGYEPGPIEQNLNIKIPEPVESLSRSAQVVGAGEGMSRAFTGFSNLVRPQAISSELAAAFKAYPQIKPPLSDVTGNPYAKKIEDLATPVLKARRVAENEQKLTELATGKSAKLAGVSSTGDFIPADLLAENLRGSIEQRKESLSGLANKVYNKNDTLARLNPTQVVTGYEQGKVQIGTNPDGTPIFNKVPVYGKVDGPVELTGVVNTVYKALQQQNLLSQNGTVDIARLASQDKKLFQTYNALRDAFQTDADGKIVIQNGQVVARPIAYEAVKKIKTNFGQGGNWSDSTPNSQESGFQHLTNLAGQDIRDSLGGWQVGAKDAVHNLDYGNRLWTERARLYGEKSGPPKSILETNNSGVTELKSTLQDTERLRRTVGAGADRKPLASQYFNDLIKGAIDDEGNFDSSKPLANWLDPNNQEKQRILYSSAQRQDLTNFLTVIKNTSQNSKLGTYAAQFRFGGGVVALSSAALVGKTLPAYSSEIVGIGLAANAFSRAVLMNPAVSRAATNLFKLPPGSSEAKLASSLVLGVLSGKDVSLIKKDGSEIPARVENGRVVPISPSQ